MLQAHREYIHRHREGATDRERDGQIDRQANIYTYTGRSRQTNRQIDINTHRQRM